MTNETTPTDGVSRRTVLKTSTIGMGTLGVSAPAAGSDSADTTTTSDDAEQASDNEIIAQTTDIVGQGSDGDVVAEDGARIWRTANAILMEVSMSTPPPGEYTYPSGPGDKKGEWWTDEVGDLEAFTLWAFIFNNPEACENGCSSDDKGGPAGRGVFGVAGHVFDGGDLTLSGVVSTDTEPFVRNGESLGVSLERPMDAEVHLAVAPHGAFKPAMLPDQLQTPAGPMAVWWVAQFDPPA